LSVALLLNTSSQNLLGFNLYLRERPKAIVDEAPLLYEIVLRT